MRVGAVICEFPPSVDDKCQECGKANKQLYYIRTCYECDEGEYFCQQCIEAMPEQMEKEAEEFLKWLYENGESED